MAISDDLRTMVPGDIYQDNHGSKWAVVGYCMEPTVIMERVWPPDEPGIRERVSGGITGLMWSGFRKLRPFPTPEP